MLFKIVDTVTHKVILDHFMSYEEAWTAYSHLPNDDSDITYVAFVFQSLLGGALIL